jgi:hypothetical protein
LTAPPQAFSPISNLQSVNQRNQWSIHLFARPQKDSALSSACSASLPFAETHILIIWRKQPGGVIVNFSAFTPSDLMFSILK